MAQQRGEELLSLGADLIIGTQNRSRVVELLRQAEEEGRPLCATSSLRENTPYEPLSISTQAGHTRAVLKIQEGCRNRCTYCSTLYVVPRLKNIIISTMSRYSRDITYKPG